MKIVIFHYHLNPGGVTRIISSQIGGLRKICPELEILLLAGDCVNPGDFSSVQLIVNPDLNYISASISKEEALQLYDRIYQFINDYIQKEDVLHFHNLNLGKNPVLTTVVADFADKGYKLFNHCHDFAEDRSANLNFMQKIIGTYYERDIDRIMYPETENVFFGTLNQFDHKRLCKKVHQGEAHCYLIPNPVEFNSQRFEDFAVVKNKILQILELPPDKLIVTYPVRVIQRKNIGEFILLAWLLKNEASFLVTLPPLNPEEVVHYKQWKKFCEEMKITVWFDVGTICDFNELLYASDFCITTSRMEGFGMAYMEPWLYKTPVVGRNLPSVTSDLIDSGMHFSLLYDKLFVTLESGEKIDFSELSEDKQRIVIQHIIKHQQKKTLFTDNAFLSEIFETVGQSVIDHNKNIIQTQYSLEQYGKKLFTIYQRLIG